MPETEGRPDPTGWAGIIQLLINALGGAAKYAVIVAGLLIALYFFVEQQNKIASESTKARQEAEKINEEKLRDADQRLKNAQTQLLDTYTKFQEIGSKQVDNLKEVLALREVVDKENRAKIEAIQSLEADKRRAETELAQHKTEGEKLNEELKLRKIQIEKARLDFEQERHERQEADRSRLKQLTESAETYNRIRDKLVDLATRVENTDGAIEDDTKGLARQILRTVQDINRRLQEFVQRPNADTFILVKPLMIGMSRDEIMKFDFKALGATLYICDSVGHENICIAAISQNDYAYNDVLGISFEKDLAVEIHYAKTLLAIQLHATDDWNKELLASRIISPEGTNSASSMYLAIIGQLNRYYKAMQSSQGGMM